VNAQKKTLAPGSLLADPPVNAHRRLVDEGFLCTDVSAAGNAERYRRGETPHTVHVWWARRPHSAMRALVFSCLCKESSEQSLHLLAALSERPSVPAPLFAEARTLLAQQYAGSPRLLDMFGGGGTIPLEAARLGADTFAVDSNELSVFVQKCLLEYPTHAAGNAPVSLLDDSGKRVLQSVAAATHSLFPLRERAFGYYWTYSLPCRSCEGRFFLLKRPWLARKRGRRIAVAISYLHGRASSSVREVDETFSPADAWPGADGKAACPHCGAVHEGLSVAQCRDELTAIVRPPASGRTGKRFEDPPPNAVPSRNRIEAAEKSVLRSLHASLPSSTLPKWSGIVNPSLYGMAGHADFLNPRQRAVLLILINELTREYKRLSARESPRTARYIIGLLSGLVDQLIDWNCRLSMWIPQNEQVGRAFCGPGVAMLWDYMETDPLMRGPANLWDKLERIKAGAKCLAGTDVKVDVRQGFAQALPFDDNSFDALVTDPPYYDNIYYNALADFFYSWKRLLIRVLEPQLAANDRTDGSRELVASSFRSGSPLAAHRDYCEQLAAALKEAERVLRPSGVLAWIYSHASLAGWEAFVYGFRRTGLLITGVQPLRVERGRRPRAMTSDALNTCMVFITRKQLSPRVPSSVAAVRSRLEEIISDLEIPLRSCGWQERDIAIAVYAHGVALLCNAAKLDGADGDRDALLALEAIVREHFPVFRVLRRKSL